MPQVNFYLSEEMYQKIKGEANKSKLITELLTAHYQIHTPITQKIEDTEKEVKRKQEELEALNQTKAVKDQEQQKREEIQEHQRIIYDHSAEKMELRERLQRDAFEKYDIPKTDQDRIFKEYLELLKTNVVRCLNEFMMQRGITLKSIRKIYEIPTGTEKNNA